MASLKNDPEKEFEASKIKKYIQGLCLTMCPNEELRLRQRENLVHILESKMNEKGQRTGYGDPRRMVKEFSRSAAGHQITAVNVRPFPVLKRTVNYLLSVVCAYEDVSWREIYDFVNDRLRAVRQDLTVQAIRGIEVVNILAPAARFYIYAHYRLCEYEATEFDPYLNLKQLNEVLLTILSIYKENNYASKSQTIDYELKLREKLKEDDEESSSDDEESEASNIASDLSTKLSNCHINLGLNHLVLNNDLSPCDSGNLTPYTNIKCFNEVFSDVSDTNPDSLSVLSCTDNQISIQSNTSTFKLTKYTVIEEMEALYLLINLGNVDAIARCLELPKHIRCSKLVSRVLEASMCWMMGNHIALIRLAPFLTPILSLALHIHLNKVQRHALGVLSVAHNSKVSRYPTQDLKNYLLFSSIESLNKACQYYGLSTTEEGVQFIKSNFKWEVPVLKPEKCDWIEVKLKDFTIADLLLT